MKSRLAVNALGEVCAIPVRAIPDVKPGDSITDVVLAAIAAENIALHAGDILVLKHKIISKAEGRLVELRTITPSAESRSWAKQYNLDPRVIELALGESRGVIRRKHGVLITETRHGFLCANSGIDVSNVDGGRSAVMLPLDPDASALRIHRALKKKTKSHIPVIIADSFGRAWREGLCDVAIGVAGMPVTLDYRGRRDDYGYRLHATEEALADELAAMAGLVSGKSARVPACIIRGYAYRRGTGNARRLIRAAKRDLFR